MIVLLKICATEKVFGKICLKVIRDTFFSNMWSAISGATGDSKFWWRVISNRRGSFKLMDLQGDPPHTIPSRSGTSWSPHKENPEEGACLFTAMILKRVSESIYFQSNKFTTCKVKDEKEVENSLMAFNLPKIIDPFQGKKYLKTYWNLNCNPQQYYIGC